MKRFLALILCLTLAFSLLPAAAAEDIEIVDTEAPADEIELIEPADEPAAVAPGPDAEPQLGNFVAWGKCGDDVTWELYDDGTLWLHGSGSTWNFTSPAFAEYKDQITYVAVNDVSGLGDCLFEGLSLVTRAEICHGQTSIGNRCFAGCSSLTEIEFCCDAPSFGTNCFQGVTATATYMASSGWTASVLQYYGGRITWVCDNKIGDDVTWFMSADGTLTFSGTGETWDFYNGERMSAPYRTAFAEEVKRLVVGDGITGLGDDLFLDMRAVEEFEIGKDVAVIRACNYSMALKEIRFKGHAPSSIARFAFSDATATAYYPADDPTWTAEVMQDYGGTITWVPYRNDKVGDNVYWSLDSSGTLTLSGSGPTWDFPDGYPSFYDKREQIKSIVVGPGITGLGDCLFWGIYNAEKVELGKNVTALGNRCFNSCSSLKEIRFMGSAPTIDSNNFYYVTATAYYYPVPGWTSSVLQNYNGTITWVCDNQIGDNVTWSLDGSGKLRIEGSGATWDFPREYPGFYYVRDRVKSATVDDGITGLGRYLFYNMTVVNKIELGKDLTSVGAYCFYGCSSLYEFRFKGHAPNIGDKAFYDVTATVYYPPVYSWTVDKLQDYTGTLTWVCDDQVGDDATWYLGSGGDLWIDGSGATWDFPREYPSFYTFQEEIGYITVNGVAGLGDYLFYGIVGTGDPIIVDISCVTEIGNLAFAHCGPLSIRFFGSKPRLGTNVFDNTSFVLAAYPGSDASWSSAVNSAQGADHVIWAANYALGNASVWLESDSGGYADFIVLSVNNQAVLVASKLSSGSYRIVPASNSGTKHNYTLKLSTTRAVENLALVFKGDANLDGAVESRDGNMVSRASVGKYTISDPLALLAADVDGNGAVESRDGNMISRASVGKYTVKW